MEEFQLEKNLLERLYSQHWVLGGGFIAGLVAVWWIMHSIPNSDSFFSSTQLKTCIFYWGLCWYFLMLLIHLYCAEDQGQLLHIPGSCPDDWPGMAWNDISAQVNDLCKVETLEERD